MPCERCGLPHARCLAHRRDGQPCGQPRMTGQRVCKMHGGKSKGAQENAEQRQAEAKADAAVRELWPGLADIEPVKDPIDLLARSAAALEHMADTVGARVNDLNGKVATGESMSQLRAEVVLLDRLLDKVIKSSDRLASLGIAERQVEIQAAQAEIVVAAVRLMLDALHGEVPGGLSPAAREVAIRAFLSGLGRGPEQLEAGGAA
ncbi:MAG TPA: HGGxSTG domain-containing protein [Nocardioides sp.]|uniref:HGGxSTG domain-containing protein n=1 Tax=Nocardioides sp. TaxID=35761 RepID=UPI002ED837D8